MSDSPVLGPDSLVSLIAGDARRLLRLAPDRRDALFSALVDASFPLETMDRQQAEALAKNVGVSDRDIRATVSLSHFLKQHVEKEPDALDQLKQKLQSSSDDPTILSNFEQLLDQIGSTAVNLDRQGSTVGKIASTMPTYEGCAVACDMRLVTYEEHKRKELIPVAIVRVQLDEDEPAIFQCTLKQLGHFIKKLEEAKESLSLIEQKTKDLTL